MFVYAIKYLKIFAELFIELLEVFFVLADVVKQLDAFLDQVLADDLEDLALLQGFTRDVQGQILRVDNALDETQILGNQLLAVVHDEHPSHIQLDVVALLFVLKQIERSSTGNKEQGSELQLTLD